MGLKRALILPISYHPFHLGVAGIAEAVEEILKDNVTKFNLIPLAMSHKIMDTNPLLVKKLGLLQCCSHIVP
jgi:hypothetical protein